MVTENPAGDARGDQYAEGQVLTIADLFPPPGHRYFTDEQIEVLREQALPGDPVTLDALTVIKLICDWRNMTAELAAHTPDGTGR